MVTRMRDATLVEQALRAADEAASRVGVTVFSMDERKDLEVAVRLFEEVWDTNGEAIMTAPLLMALAHSGNYVAGAFAEGGLVAGSVGFLARQDGQTYLHSHITGVSPRMQGRSVGFALKQHQRAWALGQGLSEVRWTFDPLVRRNGYFNITKLGAEIVDYHPDLYGPMSDGINRDDETDRCVVSWRLDSDQAAEASEGRTVEPIIDLESARTILAQGPQAEPIPAHGDAATLLAFVPADIVGIRKADPPKAAAWRRALRSAFLWGLDHGYAATGMTRSGHYVLIRDP